MAPSHSEQQFAGQGGRDGGITQQMVARKSRSGAKTNMVNGHLSGTVEGRNGRLFSTMGRGDKGKSWFLRIAAERAMACGRDIFIADADPANRTLADAMLQSKRTVPLQPIDTSDVARGIFVRDMVKLAESGKSILLDVGGNDQSIINMSGTSADKGALSDFSAVWNIAEQINSFGGTQLTVAYLLGGDPHDLALLGRFTQSPIAGINILLVKNMGVLRTLGSAADDPWAATEASPIYKAALAMGAQVMALSAIPPSIPLRLAETGESFRDALMGRGSLSHWERQALQSLLIGVESEIKRLGVAAWFP